MHNAKQLARWQGGEAFDAFKKCSGLRLAALLLPIPLVCGKHQCGTQKQQAEGDARLKREQNVSVLISTAPGQGHMYACTQASHDLRP